MPDNNGLTFTEKAVLFILMAENREIPNARLTNHHKVKLDVKSRDKLKRRGLINIRKEGRFLHLELADAGWKTGLAEMAGEPPKGAGAGGGATYAILDVIRRYLDRTEVSVEDFFRPADEPESQSAPATPASIKGSQTADVQTRIRQAYTELARRPGEWVTLADLRARLVGLERSTVDAALVSLNQRREVSIVPESNQKTLTAEQRAAAVSIGNQDRHIIAIG
jgi:hypothetical protein